MKKNHKILRYDVIFEEAEEGGYTVSVPSLPGCISEGDTFEAAKENIKEAILLYLESKEMDKEKISIPEHNNFFVGTVEVNASNFSI